MLLAGARALHADNSSNWTSSPHLASNNSFNGTGFFTEADGEEEGGYTDMQTVFLACVATLIPLVTILLAGFIIRFLWRKMRRQDASRYEGVLQREDSSDPLGGKSLSASGNILPEELKTSESQFSVTPAEEIQDLTPQSPLLSYGGVSSASAPNHSTKSANGSIITMTLKNNHLIVETEEREVPVDNGALRTTTKFTAKSSPHENNVFVVEVQHGVDPSPCCYMSALYPRASSSQEDLDECDEDEEARAQVHRPDEDECYEDEDDDEDEDEAPGVPAAANTGLSQSDLSVSSAGSNNPSYRYGNQVAYEAGRFGYPEGTQCGASPTPSELEEERLQEEQRLLGNCRNGDLEALDEVPALHRSGSLPGKCALVKPRVEDPSSSARKRVSLPIISADHQLLKHARDTLDTEDMDCSELGVMASIPEVGSTANTANTAHQYDNQAFV